MRSKAAIVFIAAACLVLAACAGAGEKQDAARQQQQRAEAASTPQTVTAVSGAGTTATYQVQEQGAAPRDSSKFRIDPEETTPGQLVTAIFDIPEAEHVKINGREVPGEGGKGSYQFVAPDLYTLTASGPEGNSASASANTYTFRLEATRKGGGEPIVYETKLKLRPPPPACPSIVFYKARDPEVTAGQSTDIEWAAEGARAATITDLTSGAVEKVNAAGKISVTPASTRSYRLTVGGPCGDKVLHTMTQDLSVTVRPR